MLLIVAALISHSVIFDWQTIAHINIHTYTNVFRSIVSSCGEGKVLGGPVKQVALGRNYDIDCSRACSRSSNCTGFNIEDSGQKIPTTCELTETPLNWTDCAKLVDRSGWKFVYREPYCKKGAVLNYETRICDCKTLGFTGQRCDRRAYDCSDVYESHVHKDNTNIEYFIFPEGSQKPAIALCIMRAKQPGLTIISNRYSAGNFNRTWADYKTGFSNNQNGKLTSYWIGLDTLHPLLNQQRSYKLRIFLKLNNESGNIYYERFHVDSEANGFRMTYAKMKNSVKWGDALLSINGSRFSTFDRDNDSSATRNCAQWLGGGWWYNDCTDANLHGLFEPLPSEAFKGMTWKTLTFGNQNEPLTRVRMILQKLKI